MPAELVKDLKEGVDLYPLWQQYGGDWAKVQQHRVIEKTEESDSNTRWKLMTGKDIDDAWTHAPSVAAEIKAVCERNNLVVPHPQAPKNKDAQYYKVFSGGEVTLSTKVKDTQRQEVKADVSEVDADARHKLDEEWKKLKAAPSVLNMMNASPADAAVGRGQGRGHGRGGGGRVRSRGRGAGDGKSPPGDPEKIAEEAKAKEALKSASMQLNKKLTEVQKTKTDLRQLANAILQDIPCKGSKW